MLINVNDVVFKEGEQNRVNESEDGMLIPSVGKEGVLVPVLVVKCPGKKYELVEGHRRVYSAKHFNQEFIPAHVIENKDKAEVTAILGNLDRKGLSPLDECAACKRLVEMGYGIRDVANMLCITVPRAKRRLMLDNLTPIMKAKFANGAIDLKKAESLATVPQDMQQQADNFWDVDTWIQHNIIDKQGFCLMQFSEAMWNLKGCDGVGCKDCKFNTSSGENLFGEISDSSYCNQKKCWKDKIGRLLKDNADLSGLLYSEEAEDPEILPCDAEQLIYSETLDGDLRPINDKSEADGKPVYVDLYGHLYALVKEDESEAEAEELDDRYTAKEKKTREYAEKAQKLLEKLGHAKCSFVQEIINTIAEGIEQVDTSDNTYLLARAVNNSMMSVNSSMALILGDKDKFWEDFSSNKVIATALVVVKSQKCVLKDTFNQISWWTVTKCNFARGQFLGLIKDLKLKKISSKLIGISDELESIYVEIESLYNEFNAWIEAKDEKE